MTEPLSVTVRNEPDHTVVVAHGDVYFDTVGPLRDVLLPLAAAERPRVVLDLANVSTCDSSGLNLMVQGHQLAARNGGWLRLAAPQPVVRLAFEVTNLTRLLAVYDSLAAATGDVRAGNGPAGNR
ncbi:STAS domain-containing protein [Luedemannella helvata]|uniref:Anti-sigma factor antagonist n=1 Tax=Luedemannella helvata TaxID=349315 RepID=A0ABP4WXU5_9ACTN